EYVRGLVEVGARVFGIGDTPRRALPDSLARQLTGYLEVPRLLDEDDLIERASAWLRGRRIERVLCNWEPLVLAAARMRDRWGIPGMSHDTVMGFRDKKLMKERVEAAGLRVPRAARARSARQARAAAETIGYPLVLKPIAGAGSAHTYRVDSSEELERVLVATAHVPEISVEEFIEGEEFTYDTICIQGRPAMENVAQYLPKPLEARSLEHLSPVIITVRDLEQPSIRPGVELGRKVLGALRMGDGFTHMEWFLTPSGDAVFGEIGARPGGAHLVDQMNHTCDADFFREWARAVCWHAFEADTTRKYNAAIIFKRAEGQGRIRAVQGLEAFMRRHGRWLVEERLLPIGAPRRDWRQTLVSDGFVLLRHPEWDEARRMATEAAEQIRLYAG
ncbi:MAG: ATP-grasp domain-containing protein, partial [Myxococcales bacterium]|nr:ATP-grasp domain-containing protein [Myxococcales bacterium]